MISIPSVPPAANGNAAGSGVRGSHAKASGRGLFAAEQASSTFAGLFSQQSATLTTPVQTTSSTSPSPYSDVLAQLTAQLKAGTPLATIVDQIAQNVGQAAAQQLQGTYAQGDIDRLRSSITQSVANALLPPSNAPPGSAAEEAAALAARLQQMVESLAGDVQNGAGQQNELSGTLLDAISAKDIPAQQKTTGSQSASALSASSVVRSLLASALSAVSASATAAAQTGASASQAVAASAVQSAPPAPAQSAAQGSAASPSSFAANVPSGSMSMTNAPDLLARMLVRAAGADASINGTAGSAVASSQTGQPTSLSPTMLAARFAALLGEDASALGAGPVSSASGQSGGSASNDTGTHTFAQTPSSAPSANALVAGPVITPANWASQLHDAIANTAPSGSPVDASSIVEQLVKGMAMRTDLQGTSQIRLSLQPENLGTVTMKLTVSGTQVSANVIASSADVRSAIVANHQELARSLADAGLTLSGFSVDVSGGDAGSDQNNDRTAGFGQKFTVHELNGASAEETASDPGSGPQLLGSTSLELFNYLA
jgi:flagellar hook-length control protein FliK